MTHEVELQELQEHLSDYLKKVEEGDTIIVRCDQKPIARIVPEEKPGLTWAHRSTPGLRFQDVPLPNIPPLNIDPVDILISDREKDRNR